MTISEQSFSGCHQLNKLSGQRDTINNGSVRGTNFTSGNVAIYFSLCTSSLIVTCKRVHCAGQHPHHTEISPKLSSHVSILWPVLCFLFHYTNQSPNLHMGAALEWATCVYLPTFSARMMLVSREGWVERAWTTALREHSLLLSTSTAWILATSGLVEDLKDNKPGHMHHPGSRVFLT